MGLVPLAALGARSHPAFELSVATPLPVGNVPLSTELDLTGAPADWAPVRLGNSRSGRSEPFVWTDHPLKPATGTLEWVAADPTDTTFTVELGPRGSHHPTPSPGIGNGDLLTSGGTPMPATLFSGASILDLNADGRPDLVGCWNYARRPGEPWSGVAVYPGIGSRLEFGEFHRLYREGPRGPEAFPGIYRAAAFGDLNGDGIVELATAVQGENRVEVYSASESRDQKGFPIYRRTITLPVRDWDPVRVADVDVDGAADLTVGSTWFRRSPGSGPTVRFDPPVALEAGKKPCFLELDGDGMPDSVSLTPGPETPPDGITLDWRKGLGSGRFGSAQPIEGMPRGCTLVAAWREGARTGLLVQHRAYQEITRYERVDSGAGQPRFRRVGALLSRGGVISASDQGWPYLCDWDADGDTDVLVGGGYGWPQVILNRGSRTRPRFASPRSIPGPNGPIRLLRNQLLGAPEHWHNMGYTYPAFVRWDRDSLPDLLLPNETNRIYWCRNVGSPSEPRFEAPHAVEVQGYPDSALLRRRSAVRALDSTYPLEPEQPFFWRTGAAFADFNGDGTVDVITHSGDTRRATLFLLRHDDRGNPLLERGPELKLQDGRPIDDRIVDRRAHWTESFRAVDWNRDGAPDLVYSVAGAHSGAQDGGSIYLLLGVPGSGGRLYQAPVTMRCFGEPIRITNHGPHPAVGDFDGDGRADILGCVEWSVYPFYRNAALTLPSRPVIRVRRPPDASTR